MTGNLCLIDDKNDLIWESGTAIQGEGPYSLVLEQDGNLVILANGSRIWETQDQY